MIGIAQRALVESLSLLCPSFKPAWLSVNALSYIQPKKKKNHKILKLSRTYRLSFALVFSTNTNYKNVLFLLFPAITLQLFPEKYVASEKIGSKSWFLFH